jgi:hypothetical protein
MILYNPDMVQIEWRGITPEEMIRDIETSVKLYRENKYAFQVGLKDLDFDINTEHLEALGMSPPFQSISQAEQALRSGMITPTIFIEEDDTQHQVLVFDHQTVGYSGFMDCVTHSLALTNHGLFEVGRLPAVSLSAQNRYWQWFLHRRLATVEEVHDYCDEHHFTSDQFMKDVYQSIVEG